MGILVLYWWLLGIYIDFILFLRQLWKKTLELGAEAKAAISGQTFS